jgi:hypothetical protein
MNDTFLNLAANGVTSTLTHIGLVDETGTELSGGSPAYARKPVTWVAAVAGLIRPNANLVFDVPNGETVAGWRAYSALSAGTDYGGENLTQQPFFSQGQYTLLAASTAIDFNAL